MAKVVREQLTPELVAYLQGGKATVLATVDEQGEPILTVLSWVVAVDARTVRLAMEQTSLSVRNIRRTGRAVLQVLGCGSAYAIRGTARVIKEELTSITFKQAMVQIDVHEVRENMFFGGALEHELTYTHTYDAGVARDLDAKVYGELRAP